MDNLVVKFLISPSMLCLWLGGSGEMLSHDWVSTEIKKIVSKITSGILCLAFRTSNLH